MPRLNRIRLGNVVYNYGKSVIGDETIDLREQSALLRMENGGGKSVLIQLLLAPYISARQRNFPKRRFTDYFRDQKPSIFLQEWELDDNAGYFLVGMLVRRRVGTHKGEGEEESAKLDFYTFVAEYPNLDNPAALDAYPVRVREHGRPGYVSFADFKGHLEGLAKENPASFRLFNMNTSGMPRRLTEKLHELGLEASEWEQLRAFNQNESGISRLVDEQSSVPKLLSGTLLPAIGRKLDAQSGADHLAAFRDTIRSYIQMMIANADIYEKKAQREAFLELLKSLAPQAEQLRLYEEKRHNDLGQLHAFSLGLKQADDVLSQKIEEQKEFEQEGQKEKQLIQVEMYSQAYWKAEAKLTRLQSELSKERQSLEETQISLEKEQTKLHAIQLSLDWQQVEAIQGNISRLETRLEAARKSAGELEKQLAAVAVALRGILDQRLEEAAASLAQLKTVLEQAEQQKKEAQARLKELRKAMTELDRQLGSVQYELKAYAGQEETFCRRHEVRIAHTLSFYEDEAVLQEVQADFEARLEAARTTLEKYEQEEQNRQQEREETAEQLRQLGIERSELKNELARLAQQAQAQEEILHERRRLATGLGMSEEEQEKAAFEAALLEKALARREQGLDADRKACHDFLADQDRLIRNLETGCELELPEAVRDILHEMEVEVQTGSEVLKHSRMSPASKQKVLETHPFAPYSLVLPENKIDAFFNELKAQNVFTASILPVISQESLRQKKGTLPETAGDVRFYLHYNSQLVDEARLQQLLAHEKARTAHEKEKLTELEGAKKRLVEQNAWLKAHPLSRKEYQQVTEQQEKLEKQRQKKQDDENALKKKQRDDRLALQKLAETIRTARDEVQKRQTALHEAESLYESYRNAQQAWQKEQALEKARQENEATQQRENQRLQEAEETILQTRDQQKDALQHQTALQKERARYENYTSEEVLAPDYVVLSAQFETLSHKLEDFRLSELNEELSKARASLEQAGRLLENRRQMYPLEEALWKPLQARPGQDLVQEQRIRELTDISRRQEKGIRDLELQERDAQKDEEAALNRIEEASGQRKPRARSETRTEDLRPRLQEVDTLILESQAEAKRLGERQIAFAKNRGLTEVQLRESGETEFQEAPVPELAGLESAAVGRQFEELRLNFEQTLAHKKSHGQRLERTLRAEQEKLRKENDEELKEALNALLEQTGDPGRFIEQLERKTTLLQTALDIIETNLKSVEEHRRHDEAELLEYIHNIHTQLEQIDKGTTIELHGRPRRMLMISQPDWEENRPLFQLRVSDFLKNIVEQVQKKPETMDEILNQQLQLTSLYNTIIGLSQVKIQVYKVEENGETRIHWQDVGKTSGAEGFLCAFTVIAAVLAYQRRDETGLISGKKRSSVMLMDNPFAVAHSPHIIRALIRMCDAMNIQFVAFSAVENAAILSAFKTIYSLRMIPRSDGRSHLQVESLRQEEGERRELETIGLHIEQETLF